MEHVTDFQFTTLHVGDNATHNPPTPCNSTTYCPNSQLSCQPLLSIGSACDTVSGVSRTKLVPNISVNRVTNRHGHFLFREETMSVRELCRSASTLFAPVKQHNSIKYVARKGKMRGFWSH